MRRKRRGDQTIAAEQDPELIRHIQSLGLRTVSEYRRWCAENGFGRGLRKHWRLRCRERAYATRSVADARRAQKKQERRKPAQVIQQICRGELTEDDVTQPELRSLCRDVLGRKRASIEQAKLVDLLLSVQSRTNLLSAHPVIEQYGHRPGNTYIAALVRIAAHHRSWLRPPMDWKPRTHNKQRIRRASHVRRKMDCESSGLRLASRLRRISICGGIRSCVWMTRKQRSSNKRSLVTAQACPSCC